MKTSRRALLVIDMIRDFVDPGAPLEVPETRKILPFIKKRIQAFREKGFPVIFVCDSHLPGDPEFTVFPPHALKGTPGSQIVDELAPSPEDIVIQKRTFSGFVGTPLEETLRKEGIEELEVTGCVTNICVFFTSADALMRGFKVVIPQDGVASLSLEEGKAALQQLNKLFGAKII